MAELSRSVAATPRSRAARLWPLLPLGTALACLSGYLASELYGLSGRIGFPLDDSWIHLAFARRLAAGEGLAFNPGELVSGSTAPLWTALLGLVSALPGAGPMASKLLGALFYLLAVDATRRLAAELGLGRGLSTLAGVLTAATSWLVWSGLSGLEITLFVTLGVWGVIFHLRERRRGSRPLFSAAALGLATLARPEGLLLLALALFDRQLLGRVEAGQERLIRPAFDRAAAVAPVLALCALAPVLAFNWMVEGSLLPTTFAAKAAGVGGWLPDLQYIHSVLAVFLRSQPYMVLFAGAGALALWRRLGTAEDRGLLPALWVLGLPLAYSILSPADRALAGNFGRYLFPLLPFVVVLGLLGLELAGGAALPALRLGGRRLPLRALLLALLLWPTLSSCVQGAAFYTRNLLDVRRSDVEMARWLRQRLPTGAVLAVNDVGALGYFLPNRLIDLAGILDPELGPLLREMRRGGGGRAEGLLRFLADRRPDYLVVFPDWFPELAGDGERFRPLRLLEIPGNITMGGDELVLYSTPWTRHPLKAEAERPPGAKAQ